MTTLLVIAKAPVAGRSKTRLCPPLTPQQAAAVAEAALGDTLAAVQAASADRRVLVLDGRPGEWLPPGFDVVPQRGTGLAARLRAAFEDAGPGFLVGMDTPQIDSMLLEGALRELEVHDAALGLAADGGFWGVGLRKPVSDEFDGVPMSSPFTGAALRARLVARGLSLADLPVLRDVDTIADAHAVAAATPGSAFAASLADVAPAVTR